MALGLAFIKSGRKLLVWTISGTIAWSGVLTVAASFSVELLKMLQLF
jgi:hypothetical protein